MQTTIYIAGPITGRPKLNIDAFREAQLMLQAQGFRAIVPHDLVEGTDLHPINDYKLIMKICFKALLDADRVVLLKDWKFSNGARQENELAKYAGIPVDEIEHYVSELEGGVRYA